MPLARLSPGRTGSLLGSLILFLSLVSFFHEITESRECVIPIVNAFNALHTTTFFASNPCYHFGRHRQRQLTSHGSSLFLTTDSRVTTTASRIWSILRNREPTPSPSRFSRTVLSLAAGGEGRNPNEDDSSNEDSIVNTDKKSEMEEDSSLSLDEILDTQFFDPDKVLQEQEQEVGSNRNNPILRWYANLLKDDYELAETLYVGVFCAMLVVITQEVLRMTMYGDNYVPFVRGGANGISGTGGKLF